MSSIVTTVACWLLTWPPNAPKQVFMPREITTTGILQWTHLVDNGGGRNELIFSVKRPTVDNLRFAGMNIMWDGIRQPTREGSS